MSFFENYKRDPIKYEKEKLAFEYLVKDTLVENLRGPEKSKQVTGLNMESNLGNNFVPSLIYTFKYNSPNQDTVKKFTFMDRVPLVFCMKDENEYLYGINFNLVPTDIRAAMLDIIYESNPDFYLKEVYSEGIHTNDNLIPAFTTDDGIKRFLFMLENRFTVPISKAYRKYKKSYIENARLIEYDVWEYIPYLVFKDAIRGASLAAVQRSIIDSSK